MKKMVLVLGLLIVLMFMTGCNDNPIIIDDEFINNYDDPNKENLVVNMSFDENVGNKATNTVDNQESTINYIFTEAVYQESRDPKWVTKSAVSGSALIFDGYSNYLTLNSLADEQLSQLTIDIFICPRAFEWDDPNAVYYNTQKVQTVVSTLDKDNNSGFQFAMYKYGDYVFQIGLGDQIIELWNEWNELDKYTWNHMTCVWNGETGHMAMYKNGEIVNFRDDAFGSLAHSDNEIFVGRSHQPEYTGNFELHMFNGAMDELRIYNKEISEEEIVSYHESYYVNGSVKEAIFEEVWLDETIVEDDINHPEYHMTPPQHWMNEPHALFYYNGYYHLFYQFNLTGPYWRQICWGHWVSDDMVNWINVKEAIVMDEDTAVKDGAWSGCASYKADGTPVLFITAGDDAKLNNSYSNQNITIATPKDLSDPYLTEWNVSKQLVAELDKTMGVTNQFRDPNVYYEDGVYYMLVGSSNHKYQGTAQVFTTTSDDFTNWEYKGELFRPEKYEKYMGSCWELTNLVKVTNNDKTISKYLFAFSPAGDNADNDVYYYLGDFDKKTCKFIPETENPLRMDIGNNVFTGPTISVDPLTGRVLICSILQDQRGGRQQYNSGWAFMAGVPRELSLDNEGNLMISPLDELYSLKGEQLINESDISIEELNEKMSNIEETQIYLHLNISNIDSEAISLFMKETDRGYSKFDYSFANLYAYIDTENSVNNRVKGIFGDYVIGKSQELDVEIFIDRGVVEIYINGYNTLTAMIYDISPKMHLESDGSVIINQAEIYTMNSIR